MRNGSPMFGIILLCLAFIVGVAVTACGNNISSSRGVKLEKGVYETHFVTQEGDRVTCFVLTKEFSSGDKHAISITCPDFMNGGGR